MSRFIDKCQQCGRDFENYHEPRAYRRFCSVGCNADWAVERDADFTRQLSAATRAEQEDEMRKAKP